jgi:hypothetical protein
MWSLMQETDNQKRLGYVSPTQVNQLELKPVINKKSEKLKGMSNKKWFVAIKKHNKNSPKRKGIMHYDIPALNKNG